MTNHERDRQLRAKLSAIEAVKGIGDEWYEARERLYNFQFDTGFYGRTGTDIRGIERTDTVSDEEGMHSEDHGRIGSQSITRPTNRTEQE